MSSSRRLAAIMFTDIQGYTKLMQQSEANALRIRERHRSVFDPLTREFGGEIIQYYGDGTLSIFSSTVNAVKCAAAMQRRFLEEPSIPVRVGIHTGDIVLSENDIIGDSVNLAARVESLGVPGSVLVSGKVADEIRSQDDLPLQKLGDFHFKNDTHKRQVFALDLPGLVVPHPNALKGKLEPEKTTGWKRLVNWRALTPLLLGLALTVYAWQSYFSNSAPPADIQRLAVFPFSNLMNDPSQVHILEGVHEAIIAELQRAGIDVTPYSTMRDYRDSKKSVVQIARELEAQAWLEGNILRSGDSLFIQIRLVDGRGATQAYLDQHEFSTDIKDLFTLYRTATRRIATNIEASLSPQSEARLATRADTIDREAMELYLKGRYHSTIGQHEDNRRAVDFYEQAIAIQPDFTRAYTGLVETYLLMGFGQLTPYEANTKFREYAQKAMELDPDLSNDHQQLAMIRVFSNWDWEGAEEELEQAIREHPNSSELWDTYCQFLWALGRTGESVRAGERAVELDPNNHWATCNLSWAYYINDEQDKAFRQLQVTADSFGWDCQYHFGLKLRFRLDTASTEEALQSGVEELEDYLVARQNSAEWYGGRSQLACYYARMGKESRARELLEEMDQLSRERFVDPTAFVLPLIFLEDYDGALDRMEEAFQQRSFILAYTIQMDPWLDPIRDQPRFQRLLEKMNMVDAPLRD